MNGGHMILSAFFFNPQGDHRMSWRHPRAAGREVFSLDYYANWLSLKAQSWTQSSSRITLQFGIALKIPSRTMLMRGLSH